ncbi:glycosyltransferase [Winogradskyella sp. 3972H.M.0a.05]|uniref:glycosyltransferase family 2 protein n=1 Tax=Winogradskyella sp. 3972H.M.0a.05 TaxID=2950277 RepID=UPI0033914C5F
MSIMFVSLRDIRRYFRRNSYINYVSILSSPFAPSISILAPMYNEEKNAISSIRSLLSNHYVNYNIIIINDGSTDSTLELLISTFSLKKIEHTINQKIETKKVKAIYKSTNGAYEKLIVIDKEQGGKSDALNAGLNFSESDYVLSIDGDCILAEDSLQKMIKPFMEYTDKTVVASGGVVRIANGCEIKDGRLVEKRLPTPFVLRFQILEYLRSFLLARVGWTRCKGLMHITGAFGIFELEKAIIVGGYNKDTLGEDMDIIVKIQRYMYETKQKFKVAYIPDPLCWTEAPSDYKSLSRQRKRWTRGNIKTLWDHRKIFFNPKYGLMGMLGYPVWILYERFGPIIELIGIVYFICASYLGHVNWLYTISFLIATYLFAIMYSLLAILTEEVTYHQYKKKGDLTKLILTIFMEPFTYHVFLLYPALLGNIAQLFKFKKKWGRIEREGFQTTNIGQL